MREKGDVQEGTRLAEAGQCGDSLCACGSSRGTDRGTVLSSAATGRWVDDVVVGSGKRGGGQRMGVKRVGRNMPWPRQGSAETHFVHVEAAVAATVVLYFPAPHLAVG